MNFLLHTWNLTWFLQIQSMGLWMIFTNFFPYLGKNKNNWEITSLNSLWDSNLRSRHGNACLSFKHQGGQGKRTEFKASLVCTVTLRQPKVGVMRSDFKLYLNRLNLDCEKSNNLKLVNTYPSLCLKCLKARFRTSWTKGSGTGWTGIWNLKKNIMSGRCYYFTPDRETLSLRTASWKDYVSKSAFLSTRAGYVAFCTQGVIKGGDHSMLPTSGSMRCGWQTTDESSHFRCCLQPVWVSLSGGFHPDPGVKASEAGGRL